MFRKVLKNYQYSIFLILIYICFPLCGFAQGYKPLEGYVGTADVAIKIAEAVLTPIYGKETIDAEKPFMATLTDDHIWIVTGTFRQPRNGEKRLGGVAEIRIDQDSGKILSVTHGV